MEWRLIKQADVPASVQAFHAALIEDPEISNTREGMYAYPVGRPDGPPLIWYTDGTAYYYEYGRKNARGWLRLRYQEPFYKSSGAMDRAKYPPKKWQADIFDALEQQIPSAVRKVKDDKTALASTRESVDVTNYEALTLSVGELRASGAIEKLYESRHWAPKYGSRSTEYHGGGPLAYTGKVPNLVFTTSEYLECYGVPRFVDGTGRARFSARGRKDAMTALRKLHERKYRIPIKETRKDGLARITTVSCSLILAYAEVSEWMPESEAEEYIDFGRGSRTKWWKLTPAPIFFEGIQEGRRVLSGPKADFTLKPWNLHADLAAVNGRAARENIAFAEYLFKVLADAKKHTPPDEGGKYSLEVFSITRSDRQLARSLQMFGLIKARAWSRIRTQLGKRCTDLSTAGFISSYEVKPVHRYGTRNVYNFHLKMNPKRCEYQGDD